MAAETLIPVGQVLLAQEIMAVITLQVEVAVLIGGETRRPCKARQQKND